MTPLMTLTQATCVDSEYFEARGSDGGVSFIITITFNGFMENVLMFKYNLWFRNTDNRPSLRRKFLMHLKKI